MTRNHLTDWYFPYQVVCMKGNPWLCQVNFRLLKHLPIYLEISALKRDHFQEV